MNTSNQNITRVVVIAGMMLLAGLSRLIPHPFNFTAIMALALFGGAKFKNTPLAIVIPLIVMLITDAIIGFYSLMPFVYGCIVVTALIGTSVGRKSNPLYVIGGSLISSVLFFLVTNAAVWYHNPQFTQDASGLMMCYDIAVPFFKNQLSGDLLFNFVLFGSYYLAKARIPALKYQHLNS
jgi:hypothetical protein